MATWLVEPTYKKSVIERVYLKKDENVLMVETGWRWGQFHVTTEDDNLPEIEAGVDILDCGYESEVLELDDGCWEEKNYDECDEETQKWLEEFLEEEGNSWLDLEQHGWLQTDCEIIINCDLEITPVEEE